MDAHRRDGLNDRIRLCADCAKYEKYITDPPTAHFFGLIQSGEHTIRDIVSALSPLMGKDTVLDKIQFFSAMQIFTIIPEEISPTPPERKPLAEEVHYLHREEAPPEEQCSVAADDLHVRRKLATTHVASALFYAEKDSKQALSEIAAAIELEPENEEYRNLRKKLEVLHKKNKIKHQLAVFETVDFDPFDGHQLKAEIERLLDLGGRTAEMYFSLAGIMKKKGYLSAARKLAEKSAEVDKTLAASVNALCAEIDASQKK